ncbi:MAG: LacI family transcriptional regulator [Bacilli bacterium]|nr:LacI family transcriptional regulator [Bacilli bacterium]
MGNKVRLEDIAQACGVTKGLVSRALAGKYNVGDETRNIIMQKAVELGYDFAKLRVKNKKNSVVIVVSSSILLKEDYWQPIIKNMYATMNRSSVKMEYFVFDGDNIDVEEVKKLKDNPCLAFIILHKNPDVVFKELVKLKKPIIEFDPKFMHATGSTQIKYSNYTSIYDATQKLIDYGHKHICFYGSDMHAMSFRERHEGFLACIDNNANKNIYGYSVNFDNSNQQYGDERMLRKMLTSNPEITAIICANDICALHAYEVVKNMGKSIPENYSIIGFDNIQDGRTATPSLSTFNVPREQIGDEIGLYVNRLIQNNRPQYSEFIIRCDFVERESIRKL